MDLMILIAGGVIGLILAAFANLLSDEFKAWQPWIVKKTISLAVSWMPSKERDRWHEEWTAYCIEVPGQLGQIFAALGLVLSAWKVNRQDWNYRLFKRVIDIVFAACSLLALLPLYLAIGIVIRVLAKRPILFGLRRIGANGREIFVLKFTTFSEDGQMDSVGRFLRWLSLDELPQLFNVLKGDMSLIGPRPRPIQRLDTDEEEFDLDEKPGLVPPPEGDHDQPTIWRYLRHVGYMSLSAFFPSERR